MYKKATIVYNITFLWLSYQSMNMIKTKNGEDDVQNKINISFFTHAKQIHDTVQKPIKISISGKFKEYAMRWISHRAEIDRYKVEFDDEQYDIRIETGNVRFFMKFNDNKYVTTDLSISSKNIEYNNDFNNTVQGLYGDIEMLIGFAVQDAYPKYGKSINIYKGIPVDSITSLYIDMFIEHIKSRGYKNVDEYILGEEKAILEHVGSVVCPNYRNILSDREWKKVFEYSGYLLRVEGIKFDIGHDYSEDSDMAILDDLGQRFKKNNIIIYEFFHVFISIIYYK